MNPMNPCNVGLTCGARRHLLQVHPTAAVGAVLRTRVMIRRLPVVAFCAVATTVFVLGSPVTQRAGAQGCQSHCSAVCAAKNPRIFGKCMDNCPAKCAAAKGSKVGGVKKAVPAKQGGGS